MMLKGFNLLKLNFTFLCSASRLPGAPARWKFLIFEISGCYQKLTPKKYLAHLALFRYSAHCYRRQGGSCDNIACLSTKHPLL